MDTPTRPASTYRLQITDHFTLRDAAALVPYLHRLGADWVYVSPVLEASPGSTHGYDVVRHDRVDQVRGGADGLRALAEAAHAHGMGLLVDIVPNHMGVGTPHANPWWWSLLRDGRGSPYATAFDVDWEAAGGRIRIPVVGDDDLLPDGRIDHLTVAGGELRYHEHRYPLRDGTEGTDPDQVHAQQHYDLVGWRRADADLNYRRFFAVSDLAGVRVEEQQWFDATHVEVRKWFRDGLVDGLRIDHPDGLVDPQGYLERLADLTGGAYVLVEKILHPGEPLPSSWRCHGTTGYDALVLVDRVLVDPAGQGPLEALEEELRGHPLDWHELVHHRKRQMADTILRWEVRRVVRDALVVVPASVVEPDSSVVDPDSLVVDPDSLVVEPASRGTSEAVSSPAEPADLLDAVAELVACFPVYRSYLPEGREHLDAAVAEARRRRPDLADAIGRLELVLGDPAHPAALRFQQTTGAVTAKGVEDSAFYRLNRLTSLNEVGGDPSAFSVSVEEFHAAMADRHEHWPATMTALSTHDTKRGEDTRARISALAEVPDLWVDACRRLLDLVPLPDPGFGLLVWQAVVGAWRDDDPDLRDRLHGYVEKAMREESERTTWADPEASYEKAVHAAVDAALDDRAVQAVLREVLDAVVDAGWSNALAAKLVQLTMPGAPDVYQGSELWEQSLVDPDNRRPVDFARRVRLLDDLDQRRGLARQRGLAESVGTRPAGLDDAGEGKLLVTSTALRLRRERPELFTTYAPVTAVGDASDHVVAFDRGGAVAVATRLPVGLDRRGGWGETALDLTGRWRDALTGREYADRPPLRRLLSDLPVALLVREDA